MSTSIPYHSGTSVIICSTFQVVPLLTHKGKISDEALSLLKTLLFSGNETVQEGLEFVKETREDSLFIFLQNKLRRSALHCRET